MVRRDSDLVIIDDEEELAYIQNRIAEINETRDWWIGNEDSHYNKILCMNSKYSSSY